MVGVVIDHSRRSEEQFDDSSMPIQKRSRHGGRSRKSKKQCGSALVNERTTCSCVIPRWTFVRQGCPECSPQFDGLFHCKLAGHERTRSWSDRAIEAVLRGALSSVLGKDTVGRTPSRS